MLYIRIWCLHVVSSYSFKRVWKISRSVYRTLPFCVFKTGSRVCIYMSLKSIKTLNKTTEVRSWKSVLHDFRSIEKWISIGQVSGFQPIELQLKCSLLVVQFSIFFSPYYFELILSCSNWFITKPLDKLSSKRLHFFMVVNLKIWTLQVD